MGIGSKSIAIAARVMIPTQRLLTPHPFPFQVPPPVCRRESRKPSLGLHQESVNDCLHADSSFLDSEADALPAEHLLFLQMSSHLYLLRGAELPLSLIHISEPTRRTPISYAVFCLK